MIQFTVIVPNYNRPDEVDELLESLAAQEQKNFDIVLVEDGSTIPCKDVVWILRIRPLTFTTKVNAQSISYLNIVKKDKQVCNY